MLFLIFITKNMKEESGVLITDGPLRPPRLCVRISSITYHAHG
jgi:hypothetical protein